MPTSTEPFSSGILGLYCQIANPTVKSLAAWFWTIVTTLWPWYWTGIVVFLIGWTVFEKLSGIGTSENGFSRAYNRVVGSGIYMFFQSLVYVLLLKILGDLAYCQPFSLGIHYLVFLLTGGFLHAIYFWPYWKIPLIGKVRLH